MTSRFFDVRDSSGVSAPRREAAALAASLGFDESRAGQVALIVSELATNLVNHAKEGQVLIRPLFGRARPHGAHPYSSRARFPATEEHVPRDRESMRGIEILAVDRGPGVRVMADALRDGYSTFGTRGVGLGAVQRQSDEFEIYSPPNAGTIVMARVWARPLESRGETASAGASGAPEQRTMTVAAVSVPIKGETVCGDGWAAHLDTAMPTILVADGLGHGLGAAEAASLAVDTFDRVPLSGATAAAAVIASASVADSPPATLIGDLHAALRPTRGAAVAAVQFDLERGIVRFAGLGNVSGILVSADRKRQAMVSHNGTAGHVTPRLQEFTYPWQPGMTVVLQSDGLTANWNPADYPDLWTRDPAVIAGLLHRDLTRGRDDATVVVARLNKRA